MSIFNRPEDQYKESKAPEMIKQLENERRCKFTTVKSYQKILFSGHFHVGVLNHYCIRDKGHEGDCECNCGMRFKGWN